MTAITLRKATIEDINEEYVSWYQNKDGHLDYFTGSGRVFDHQTLMGDFQKGEELSSWFYYLIIHNESNRAIGTLKIGPIDRKNKIADMVCLIGNRDYLGKGYSVEALKSGIKIAFEKYDIRRLQSGMLKANTPSIKAYTRAGWFIEATMKGFYWIDNKSVDRVCVACLNPKYFSDIESK